MAGEKSVRLSILGDNTDAKAKLQEVDDKAKELAAEDPSIDVKADTLKADAELEATKELAKGVGDESAKAEPKVRGLAGAVVDFALGGLPKGVGEMSLFQKAVTGLGIATGLGEPIVAGLTTGVMALASGVASAGLGLGVFGVVAEGAYEKISAANTAGTKLTGGLGDMQAALKGATNQYDTFVSHNLNGVAKIMSQGIGLLPKVFAAMQPFLAPTEAALSHIIGDLSKGMSSSGFKSWIDAFSSASGKNLENLAGAIGHIIVGLGGILKAFLPMATDMTGGLDSITAKFAKWGTTLSSHSGFQSLTSMAKQDMPLVISAFKNISGAVKNLMSDMAGLSTFSNSHLLLELVNPVTALLKALSSHPDLVNLALWGYAVYSSFSKVVALKNGIMGVFSTVKSVASGAQALAEKFGLLRTATAEEDVAQEGLNLAFLASPITWIVAGLALVGVAIYELTKHSAAFRDFWKAAWKDIVAVAEDVFDWVKGHWPLILGILTGPVGLAAAFVITHWKMITTGAEDMYHDVVNFFKNLPHEILSAVGNLGSLLFSAGENVIEGLLHGIEGAVGGLLGYVENIGGKISSVFKSVMGIFSPSRVFAEHGKNIVLGLVSGIQGNVHLAENAVSSMAQRAINASGGSFHGAAGAAGNTLQMEWVGGSGADQEFITWLKKNIRVRGGNPAVLGR